MACFIKSYFVIILTYRSHNSIGFVAGYYSKEARNCLPVEVADGLDSNKAKLDCFIRELELGISGYSNANVRQYCLKMSLKLG